MELNAKRAVAVEREKHLLEPIIKFGSSCNVTDRIKAHKRSFGKEKVFLDKVIETDRYTQVENTIRVYSNTSFTDETDHTHTEIIEYETESQLLSV
ncbi:hypothetical protein SAGO17_0018 [Mimivirus AB-566-O17]|uniref:Uncharacterized protein n=1 Tax=Mimivirus AB-566-O17 TaxID=1988039 RepID=A0A1X9VNP6_9VIRU|nr:hypothetical protein SAGO17_0018 [Mimivirus AB-566-O17]